MKRLLLVVAFLASACGGVHVAPPPRPPDIPFQAGLVVWPGQISEAECARFREWHPLLRMPVQTAAIATQALDDGDRCESPVLLLVETVDDDLIRALPPVSSRAWGIEACNECAFIQDAPYMAAFWRRSYDVLRAGGFRGRFITGGIANIQPSTLRWEREALIGVPAEALLGFHLYDDWPSHIAELLEVAAGRTLALTEWGSYGQANEAAAATHVRADIPLICQTRSVIAPYYQIHSGTTAADDFGVFVNGHWRETESVLRMARC